MDASNFIDEFLHEADDLLAKIEATALSMGSDETGREAVNEIFRAFHTLKGNAAMFGFSGVAGFTHHVESLLDKVRMGVVPVTGHLSNLMLSAADHIQLLFTAAQGGAPVNAAAQEALLASVHQLSSGVPVAPAARPVEAVPAQEPAPEAVGEWRIEFRPSQELFLRGAEPILVFDDLRQLGSCEITGHLEQVPDLETLDTDKCHVWWTIRLKSAATSEAIREVFLFVADENELRIEPVAGEAPAVEPAVEVEKQATEEAKSSVGRVAGTREATVRVPSAKLDRLVNLVGELVMNQSRLATAAARYKAADLAAPVKEIDRLVAALRDDVLQIRMMPIGSIFGRFRRLVHDLSHELGKEIHLVTEGEDTELDKSVLDQLAEPLVHLVRNSADHGIETGAERVAKGKPAAGTIRLSATHRGSDVVVSIEDDGKGMNRQAIRAKAISKRLISPEANLSDKDILNLILLPGFSTAETVTNLSGRGVGMDAVKRQIDALHGTLTLSSEQGKGSAVALTLPLTLAIIDGLLVEIAGSQYILPMAAVTENVELLRENRVSNNGRNLVTVRGKLIPYIDLREAFEVPGEAPPISKIVLVRHDDERIGLVVDRVLGTHQTVIQPMGAFFRRINIVSGSTVMGDGRVALILDIAAVVRLAEQQCRREDGLVAA